MNKSVEDIVGEVIPILRKFTKPDAEQTVHVDVSR